MKTKLSNIADIRTGVFAKTDVEGDLAYIQPKYFDRHGDLDTSLRLDINANTISDKHLLQNGDLKDAMVSAQRTDGARREHRQLRDGRQLQ